MVLLVALLGPAGCGAATPAATEPDEANARTLDGEREAVLRRHVDHVLDDQDDANTGGIVVLALNGLFIGMGAVAWDRKRDAGVGIPLTVGVGAASAVAITGLALGEDGRDLLLPSTPFWTFGSAGLAFTFSERTPVEPRLAGVAFTVINFGTGALLQIQTAARYGRVSRLRRHRARLASKKPLTPGELRALEQDFLRTDVPLPPLVMALPTFAGSVLAIATLSKPDDNATYYAAFGVAGIGVAVWYSIGDYAVPHYRKELRSLGLELDAGLSGPGFFVRGRF